MSATLAEIYARIPSVKCKGLCQECCGPIGMSPLEMERLRGRVGEKIQPTSMGPFGFGLCSKSLTCPLLGANGRCTVYDLRPVICRVWGAVKSMRCPHGCRPKRWLSKEESFELLRLAREAVE